MRWFDYVLVSLFVSNVFYTLGMVGKPRRVLVQGDAAASLIVNGLLVAGLVFTR